VSSGLAQTFILHIPLFFALLSTCSLTQFYYLNMKCKCKCCKRKRNGKGKGKGRSKSKWNREGKGRRKSKRKRKSDRRLNPDLPRGTVNLIGGELDVDDPKL
jgi:hypothetical protein